MSLIKSLDIYNIMFVRPCDVVLIDEVVEDGEFKTKFTEKSKEMCKQFKGFLAMSDEELLRKVRTSPTWEGWMREGSLSDLRKMMQRNIDEGPSEERTVLVKRRVPK